MDYFFIKERLLMAKWMNLKINNSKDASVKTGKWKDPGASLYDQLLNAGYFPSDNVDDPNNLGTHHYLKETYLVAPVDKIKCGPYGQTPYSRSGCKYPHHIIRKGELIVHQAGLKAAYSRAKQMGYSPVMLKNIWRDIIKNLICMKVLQWP
jgi:hypothetical protein